jgi:galactonate dehydratase
MNDTIDRILMHGVRVSPKTRWLFLAVQAKSGLVGLGEASLQGREAVVKRAGDRLAPSLLGMPAGPVDMAGQCETLPEAAFLSAIDQALHDIAARREGKRLADHLGGARRERVPLYANINRRTVDRSPAGFAASAGLAVDAGFTAFKLAPFDEVDDAARLEGRILETMRPGLDRIAAVAGTIGPERELMVDCHWRFDEASATTLVKKAAGLGVRWLECPIAETGATIPAIRRLRALANDAGMRLAGCEELVGVEQSRPFAEAGVYNVMMPDVKYAGGVGEMMRLAHLFEQCGVAYSPHNPAGPIAHAASLHVSAAVASFDRLEVQFDESDLFWRLTGGSLPRFEDGHSVLPEGPGLGVTLDPDLLASASERVGDWSLARTVP